MILSFNDLQSRASQIFPDLKIAFKNESVLMKILGSLLFFNPGFMNSYITTIGSTIYFQNRDYVNTNQSGASIVLLHELTHIYDSQKRNKIVFSLLYLLPQLLVLLFIPLLLIFTWKIALISLVFLLPLPSYFRMKDERKAYTISLYVMFKMREKYNILFDLDTETDFIISQFKYGAYYFMWPFADINKYFTEIVAQIKQNKQPLYEPELYNIIDRVLG